MIPETRYARDGARHIAYQVVGEGPLDLAFLPDWINHLELQWEEPRQEGFLTALASFSRLILFNFRGMGASDPVPITESPTIEQWVDDLRLVLDTVDSERPAVFGVGAGGIVASLFAATVPERAAALVLFNSTARGLIGPGYPSGVTPEFVERGRRAIEEHWGEGTMPILSPADAGDDRMRRFIGRLERLAASPGMALAVQRMLLGLDIRHVLGSIRAPTLVLHRVGAPVLPIEHGRYLAEHILGAVLRELPGEGHAYWAWGDVDVILDEVQEFLTGMRSGGPPDRVLATVLFTDIVDSTATAAALGDRTWKERIREHDEIVRRELARHGGREVHTTGDGFLATFDAPARAIRCAAAIRDAARDAEVPIRAGLHTGEIELHGDDVAGIGVHIGARVSAAAAAGEVWVSRTVVDLVIGSGLSFVDRGEHTLKGVPGEWQLYSLGPPST